MIIKENKKNRGQFYTVNSSYILKGLPTPPQDICSVIEPFAGQGDLITWLNQTGYNSNIEAYDIEPKASGIIQRDSLLNPPDYTDSWIITNPPYLARNKCKDKTVFDFYSTNDLYKAFILSLTKQKGCRGGIFIIPVGFFLSPRALDVQCRNAFLSKYKITKVRYFEEDVFPDTPTTVVAFSFEKSETLLTEQNIEWEHLPSGTTKIFNVKAEHDWIVGGSIYKLDKPNKIKIRRYVSGQQLKAGEQITGLTLTALDSGKKDGRISLKYREGYVYAGKDTSRSYATLCISGRTLTIDEQKRLAELFDDYIEKKRLETWSLFLPQFRESKEYARKRIPFELAYDIVLHLIKTQL
jgi:hypothetical protein